MYITKINLDGLDLISNDYFFNLSGLFDLEKDIVTNDLYIDGENYGRSKNKSKSPVLNGVIKNYNFNSIISLNKILTPNKLKPLIISIDEIGDLICYVEIQNRITGDMPELISCQLLMPDPYLYMLNADIIELGSIYSAGISIPIPKLPFNLGGIVEGAEGEIYNSGNCEAYPVIKIVGTCSNITIINKTTGESISLDVALTDDDTLIIDCSNRTVFLNGERAISHKINYGWIHCEIGENKFIFTRDSLQNKKHCSISLRSRWR